MTALATPQPGQRPPLPMPIPMPVPPQPMTFDPMLTVKKGDTVIWMRGGQREYSDGIVAFVSNVYIGGEGIDLLVPNGAGVMEPQSLVQHVSERDTMSERRIRSSGLWMFTAEHHLILDADRAERDAKKLKQATPGS